MFLLMYNKHTIYKELMKIDNHYVDASVAIAINTDDVEPDFFDRIKINNWDDHNKYLFIFNEISKNTVANFIKGVKLGVWKGIIFDFPEAFGPYKMPNLYKNTPSVISVASSDEAPLAMKFNSCLSRMER